MEMVVATHATCFRTIPTTLFAQAWIESLTGQVAVLVAERDDALAAYGECVENPPYLDEDLDGEHDATDTCPGTSPSAPVDGNGCSAAQSCAAISIGSHRDRARCALHAWSGNDGSKSSCYYDRTGDRCAPAPFGWRWPW
jgi:hypothetical protein